MRFQRIRILRSARTAASPIFLFALFCLALVQPARAYSVLTHEAIIDLAWKDSFVPLLKARFPQATDDDLTRAHAFAYGGSVIQDLGYYPHGEKLFSDLLHYSRSGDFVLNLINDSTDLDEYAFALGAMAHYIADTDGHPAVNEATAYEYPKLREKYGPKVTYDEDPVAHLRTEFGFDVVQVGKGRYATEDYRNFIGFEVSKPLLERAFRDTYGFEVKDIMPSEDRAINSYRHDISTLIPEFTRVALVQYGKQLKKDDPSFNSKKFLYKVSRSEYEKQYGKDYEKPGTGAHMLSIMVRVLPKIGPLKALKLQIPDPHVEDLYLKSLNKTNSDYRTLLASLETQPLTREAHVDLPNRDLDTGDLTKLKEYALADHTYDRLLMRIVKNAQPVPPSLRQNMLDFYAGPPADASDRQPAKKKTEEHVKDDAEVQRDLGLLRAAKPDQIKTVDAPTDGQPPPTQKPGTQPPAQKPASRQS